MNSLNFFKALANQDRLSIVFFLNNAGPSTHGAICKGIGTPGPHTSQNLKILLKYGLVTSERSGKNVTYTLNEIPALAAVLNNWTTWFDSNAAPKERKNLSGVTTGRFPEFSLTAAEIMRDFSENTVTAEDMLDSIAESVVGGTEEVDNS